MLNNFTLEPFFLSPFLSPNYSVLILLLGWLVVFISLLLSKGGRRGRRQICALFFFLSANWTGTEGSHLGCACIHAPYNLYHRKLIQIRKTHNKALKLEVLKAFTH